MLDEVRVSVKDARVIMEVQSLLSNVSEVMVERIQGGRDAGDDIVGSDPNNTQEG